MTVHSRGLLVSVFVGAICGGLFVLLPAQADTETEPRLLALNEMSGALGGCPNVGCEDQACSPNGSCIKQTMFYFACWKMRTESGDKCLKLISNPFARCGNPGSMTGFTCTESSGNGCVIQKLGDPDGNGQCLTTYCTTDAGTCGPTFYVCNASGCE